MRQHDLIRALVRVWRTDAEGEPEAIVGTGVLVSPRHVLTCAHVVTEALGLAASGRKEVPKLPILFDFPASAPGRMVRGRVVVWHARTPQPEGVYDIAGLAFEGALPDEARAVPLVVLERPWDHPCRVFGFPAGRPYGNYAEGTLKDLLANGWVMIRGGADAREFTRPGYSGGPVFTEEGVVGMLTEGDRDQRVREAVMIPTSVLLAAWPELYRLNTTCPYQGLSSFREDDSRFFRARDEIARRLAEVVSGPPLFTVLAGASGSGKSSLISAGIVPRLRSAPPHASSAERAVHAEPAWQVASLSPGIAPFEALAQALLSLWQPGLTGTEQLVELKRLSGRLREGSLSAADVAADILRQRAFGKKLLLVLDQCEELFTQTFTQRAAVPEAGKEPERSTLAGRFLGQLLGVLEHPETAGRVGVLVGIRTDFLDTLLEVPIIAGLQNRYGVIHYLGAVDDLREVIEGPLREVGIGKLEPGLTERILNDVEGEPNPLPLLEFTLTELWHRQQAGGLTHAAYDELGGVTRALATYAQATFERLSPDEQAQAKEVFLQLMQPMPGLVAARRVASFAELGEDKRDLIKTLADKRLVVTAQSPDRPDTVEVVHEALFEGWPLLKRWVREGWDFRRWQEELRAAMRDWHEHDRYPDYLLQGARLAAAEGYLDTHGDRLTEEERAYVREGLALRDARAHEEAERLQREARAQRRASRILAMGLAVALVLSSAAGWQWTRAERQAEVASGLNVELEDVNEDLKTALERSQQNARRARENARSALANKLSAQGLLATQNPGPTTGDPRLGALLAAQAVAVKDNVQSRGNLLRVVQSEPVPFSDEEMLTELSPDGHTLAVASRGVSAEVGPKLLLWDLPTRRLFHTVPIDFIWLDVFAFSPNGKMLATGSRDRSVRLWDVATGEPVGGPLTEHDYQVVGLAFSPDGGTLLSSGMDGTLLLWDLAAQRVTGRIARQELEAASATTQEAASLPVRRQSGLSPHAEHLDWLRCVAVSPDGRILALAGQEGAVWLLDFATLKPLGTLAGASGARSLAFSPDGASLAVGDREGAVQMWEVSTRQPLGDPFLGLSSATRALAFHSDGDLLATADAEGNVLLQDLTDQSQTALTLGAENVHSVSFMGDNLFVRGREGDRSALWQVGLAAGTPEIEKNLRVTWESTTGVGLWDVRGGSSLSAPLLGALDSYAVEIVYSPDGGRFVTRSNGRQARLWDAATRKPVGPAIADQEDIESVAFSPDGRVFATGSRDGRVILRDGTTGEPLGEPLALDIPRAVSLAFRPDGQHLAVGTEGWVVVWDLEADAVVGKPEWDTPAVSRMDLVESLSYSPDGSTLVGSYETYVYLWDAETLEMIGTRLPGMAGDRKVRRVLVSPDGGILVATYNDGLTVAFWNLGTLEPITVLDGVHDVAFSPDGRLFVTGGLTSLTFWNAAAIEPLGDPVPAHSSFVNVLAFSPDGRTLVSSAVDNSVLFWQVDLASWLASACTRAERNLTAPEWSRYLGTLPYVKTCPNLPADPSAAELLLTQGRKAAARGDQGATRTLYRRAFAYALELDTPDVISKVCLEATDKRFLEGIQARCGEHAVAREVSDVED